MASISIQIYPGVFAGHPKRRASSGCSRGVSGSLLLNFSPRTEPREAARHLWLPRLSSSCSSSSGRGLLCLDGSLQGQGALEASEVSGQDLRRAMLQHGAFQGILQGTEMPICV